MLIRFDPFREAERLTNEARGQRPLSNRSMPIDVFRAGDSFVALLDLPGVDPETIELTVDKKVLTVNAQRTEQHTGEVQKLISERPSGQFARQLHLGDGLDLEHVTASYENGVLRVSIPVAEQAKPRRVQVTLTAPGTTQVEAGSTNEADTAGTAEAADTAEAA
jgi:HSP20 family protein